MKKNFEAVVLIILILVVIGATVWNAVNIKFRSKTTTKVNFKEKLISTSKSKYINFVKTLNWFGKVVPTKEITLKSLTDGEITWANSNGKIVKKGEVLFRLGGRILNSKINSLKSNIANLKGQIKIEENIVRLKKLSFENRLIKKSELLSSLEKLANLRAKLKTYTLELKSLKALTIIRSPINGLFRKMAYKGELITKGSPIGSVYSDKVRIVGYTFSNNPHELLNKTILVDNRPVGAITKILPLRRKDGAIVFWADKLYEKLNAGESLEGRVEIGEEKCVAVPENAVAYNENGKPFVFVKTKKGYRKVAVKVGETINGWTLIKSGITANERVITSGSYELLYKNFNKIFKASD